MSKIYITNIVGTGIYDNPSSDAVLAMVTTGLNALLSVDPGVVGLTYTSINGFIRDSGGPDGAEGTRTLNCIIDGFEYNNTQFTSEANTDAMLAAIAVALKTVPGGELLGIITDVGVEIVNMWGIPPQ